MVEKKPATRIMREMRPYVESVSSGPFSEELTRYIDSNWIESERAMERMMVIYPYEVQLPPATDEGLTLVQSRVETWLAQNQFNHMDYYAFPENMGRYAHSGLYSVFFRYSKDAVLFKLSVDYDDLYTT